MALTATIHPLEISLSDVDRGVYATLELRLARHPSETMRWMLTRALAYCLSYEEGIAFSKGGLSSNDEAPLAVHDATGALVRWIEIGTPSAERLHKASKAAPLAIYTYDLAQLRRQTEGRTIHQAETVEVYVLDGAFLDALASRIERRTRLEVTRTEGVLYVTVGGITLETTVTRASLLPG